MTKPKQSYQKGSGPIILIHLAEGATKQMAFFPSSVKTWGTVGAKRATISMIPHKVYSEKEWDFYK